VLDDFLGWRNGGDGLFGWGCGNRWCGNADVCAGEWVVAGGVELVECGRDYGQAYGSGHRHVYGEGYRCLWGHGHEWKFVDCCGVSGADDYTRDADEWDGGYGVLGDAECQRRVGERVFVHSDFGDWVERGRAVAEFGRCGERDSECRGDGGNVCGKGDGRCGEYGVGDDYADSNVSAAKYYDGKFAGGDCRWGLFGATGVQRRKRDGVCVYGEHGYGSERGRADLIIGWVDLWIADGGGERRQRDGEGHGLGE
jgi:hypothetical protein